MDVKLPIKIHNRFDIEVKDITTGEIVQRAEAENIILNRFFSTDCLFYNGAENYGAAKVMYQIHYGSGTGTLSPERTALFNQLGSKESTFVERVLNVGGVTYLKKKIIITPSENVGATITEVGVGMRYLCTHALLKDSEGNQISLGPKTDTQEITIYATTYYTFSLADGINLMYNINSLLLKFLLGEVNSFYSFMKSGDSLYAYSSTNTESSLSTNKPISFIVDVPNKTIKTPRLRFESSQNNGKIKKFTWGQYWSNAVALEIIVPNTASWQGYHLEGKNIGIGDGNKTKFILPWSDINTSKQYDFYVDGAKMTTETDYVLANAENETSVTFLTAPANGLVVTGDWWVDYIPKDNNHVLDITFSITFGEGV